MPGRQTTSDCGVRSRLYVRVTQHWTQGQRYVKDNNGPVVFFCANMLLLHPTVLHTSCCCCCVDVVFVVVVVVLLLLLLLLLHYTTDYVTVRGCAAEQKL